MLAQLLLIVLSLLQPQLSVHMIDSIILFKHNPSINFHHYSVYYQSPFSQEIKHYRNYLSKQVCHIHDNTVIISDGITAQYNWIYGQRKVKIWITSVTKDGQESEMIPAEIVFCI